jgi:hypothetical protein
MIVVVETNFILELVLQQEHSSACEEILALCSRPNGTRLVIPAFAVAEAGMKLERHRGERRVFIQKDVARYVRESGRARVLRSFEGVVRQLDKELIRAENDEADRWLDFRVVTLGTIEIIPLTADMLEETIALQLGKEIDQLPDALVFASLKGYLQGLDASEAETPRCFISTDKKAFGKSRIVQQLGLLNCAYIDSFVNAVAHMRHLPPSA